MSKPSNCDGIDQSDREVIQFQGYRIASMLGRGAFGRVYHAYDDLGNEYAIKAVPFHKMTHRSSRSQTALDEFSTSKFLSNAYYDAKSRKLTKRSSQTGARKLTRKECSSLPFKRHVWEVMDFLVNNGIPLSKDLSEGYAAGKNFFDAKEDLDDEEDRDFYYAFGKDRTAEALSEDLLKLKNSSKRSDYEGVVIIYDVFVKNMNYYLVMEKLNGETLENFVRRQNAPLPESQVKRYMYQGLKGMNFLWKNGIVHRDIKPENIMFTQSDCKELKLIDIGLGRFIPLNPEFDDCLLPLVDSHPMDYYALMSKNPTFNPSKLLTDPSGDSYKEMENAFLKQVSLLESMKDLGSELSESDLMRSPVGSPFYVSPEVMLGRGYSRNCDLWSLGMCFYFLATGKDLVRRRPKSFSREKRLIWESASKKGFVLQGISSPGLNRILCSMLSKSPMSPEELLSDPWFDECRKEDEMRRSSDDSQPPDDFFPPSPMGFNLRSC